MYIFFLLLLEMSDALSQRVGSCLVASYGTITGEKKSVMPRSACWIVRSFLTSRSRQHTSRRSLTASLFLEAEALTQLNDDRLFFFMIIELKSASTRCHHTVLFMLAC